MCDIIGKPSVRRLLSVVFLWFFLSETKQKLLAKTTNYKFKKRTIFKYFIRCCLRKTFIITLGSPAFTDDSVDLVSKKYCVYGVLEYVRH